MTDKHTKPEYAASGVDYTKIEPFKMAMVRAGKRTLGFPNRRGVFVDEAAWAPTGPSSSIGAPAPTSGA